MVAMLGTMGEKGDSQGWDGTSGPEACRCGGGGGGRTVRAYFPLVAEQAEGSGGGRICL